MEERRKNLAGGRKERGKLNGGPRCKAHMRPLSDDVARDLLDVLDGGGVPEEDRAAADRREEVLVAVDGDRVRQVHLRPKRAHALSAHR